MKRLLRVSAVLLLAATATAACGKDDDGGDASAGADATTTTVGQTANGSTASLTLVASEIKFDKASMTAKADQPVTITLTKNDTVEHNITIEKLDVDQDAEGGESETTEAFTPAAGTYEYHCEYHPSAMKGQLLVS